MLSLLAELLSDRGEGRPAQRADMVDGENSHHRILI